MNELSTRIDPSRIVNRVVAHHDGDVHELVQILREVQEALDWISPETIDCLVAALGVPRTKIEAVAGFYSFFYLVPRGRYRVLFSDNITDRMAGSEALKNRMCRNLWIEPGKVSEDGLVSVDLTSCTGMCDQGPGMLVNNRAITRLDDARLDAICELIRDTVPLEQWPADFFRVDSNVRRADMLLGGDMAPGAAMKAATARGAAGMLEELRLAGLRGRGGAGFATATKWSMCREAAGEAHYVVCNADEGEPGTFKDRVLLTERPDLVFEGMTLCAQVLGAQRGFLYLRGEYRYLLDALQAVLERRRTAGLLGRSIMGIDGFDFDIRIHLGAGAYVCGEESALIESLEGKRGTPRNRPPFPVTCGYRDQPTVVNNVETFASAALIGLHGGVWFAAVGSGQSAGTKLLSVSGDCERPGIYEYPFGVTIAQVLEDCGAEDTQAVQVGGPSGMCIAASEFSRRIAFEDVPTAGAFMAFGAQRDMFDVARNFTRFFAHESCGFCTPCRVGTSLLNNLMDKLARGQGSPYDFSEIEKLNRRLQSLSHCGLGHSACNPVLETIAKFRSSYERRLVHTDYVPAFDLDRALSAARQMTRRKDAGAHIGEDS